MHPHIASDHLSFAFPTCSGGIFFGVPTRAENYGTLMWNTPCGFDDAFA